jgi:hypothetical protein
MNLDSPDLRFLKPKEWIPYLKSFVVAPTILDNIRADLQNISPRDLSLFDQEKYHFLLSEKSRNAKTLAKWISMPQLKTEEIRSVIFQILYTFEVFNRLGFRHNDAHIENIFIEDWSDNQDMSNDTQYNVDGVWYRFKTKSHFVKIFDFDLSFFNCDRTQIHPDYHYLIDMYETQLKKHNIKNCVNTRLETAELCQKYGLCSHVNPKYDTFNTLWDLKLEIENVASPGLKKLTKWIETHLGGATKHLAVEKDRDGDLMYHSDNSYVLTRHLVNDPTNPTSDIIPTDDEMSSTLQLLQSDYFAGKRTNRPRPTIPSYSLPLAL